VASGALRQCIDEFVIGPGADAGLRIWRDVGRQQRSEWRLDRTSPRHFVAAAGQRMACGAVADDGKVVPTLDLPEALLVDACSAGWSCRCGKRDARDSAQQPFSLATHGRAVLDFSGTANG